MLEVVDNADSLDVQDVEVDHMDNRNKVVGSRVVVEDNIQSMGDSGVVKDV